MNRLRNHDEVSCVFCARLREMSHLTSEQVVDANAAHDDVIFFDDELAKLATRVDVAQDARQKAITRLEVALLLREEKPAKPVDMWQDIASDYVRDA